MSMANFLKEFCYSWCREVGPGDKFVVVVVFKIGSNGMFLC